MALTLALAAEAILILAPVGCASAPEAEPTPAEPMRPRIHNPTVGWFTVTQMDFGDDPVRSSGYGIANLKRVLPNLPDRTATPGRGYDDLAELYGELVSSRSRTGSARRWPFSPGSCSPPRPG